MVLIFTTWKYFIGSCVGFRSQVFIVCFIFGMKNNKRVIYITNVIGLNWVGYQSFC
jgi:hypothetical protein